MKHKKLITLFLFLVVIIAQISFMEVNTLADTLKVDSELSKASNVYKSKYQKLKSLQSKTPAFTIQGEIINNSKSGLYVYGIAVGDVNAQVSSSNPGWQVQKGNLMIINPNKSKLNYIANIYADENHYFVKISYGKNAFGQSVPVKVYTKTVPSNIVNQQKKVNAAYSELSKKVTAYNKYYLNKYKSILASSNNTAVLKSNSKEVYKAYNFIKQSGNSGGELLYLTIAYYNKIKEKSPNDIDNLYALAAIYKFNGNLEQLQKIYDCIAKVSPEEFLKRTNLKTEIKTAAKTLENAGSPEYAAAGLETYISKYMGVTVDETIIKAYLDALYTSGVKYKNKNDVASELKFLLKVDELAKKYKLEDIDKDLTNKMYEELANIYLAKGETKLASGYFDKLGYYGFDEKTKTYASDEKYVELADQFAKKGDLKNAYKYFNQLVEQYNLYNSDNQNVYVKLKSTNADSNLLLGLAYLNHTRSDNEQLNYGLYYLSQAYKLNPDNSKVNNALGYVYSIYYESNSEKFAALESKELSQKEWAIKVINYYIKAIQSDPKYKMAYGNLYQIYSSDYESGVREALKEINKLENADDNTYFNTIKSMKDEFWEKSSNKRGIDREEDF